NPDNSTNLTDYNGFSKKLVSDGAAGGSHGLTNADFTGPLRYRYKHNIHQSDGSPDQGNSPDDCCGKPEILKVFKKHFGQIVALFNFKTILLSCPYFAYYTKQSCCF